MALSIDELRLLKQSVEDAAMQRKKIRTRPKTKSTKKQKKIEHLTDEQAEELRELQRQMGSMLNQNSNIIASRKKDENTPTKRDLRKGKNNNQGAEMIHSEGYMEDLIKLSRQLVKYCYETHGIKELKQIKPRMAEAFCREKMESKTWAHTTLGTRIGQLRKIGESVSKQGIKQFSRIVTSNTEQLKKEYRPPGKLKDHRTRGKKEDGSGLSLREARIISKHAGKLYGPMGEVMLNILIEAGPRSDELMKLKWEHFDFASGTMSMKQKNMTKGGRPRIIEDLSPKTLEKLKSIYDSGLFPNPKQTIFRSHFHSEKGVRKVIEESARSGHVANLATHAFRNATKEYQTKKFQKELKAYKKKYGEREGSKRYKEHMADKLMRYVGIDPKLNPIIDHSTGERKFSYEKIASGRVDGVINSVVTQMFGHNRRDVLYAY